MPCEHSIAVERSYIPGVFCSTKRTVALLTTDCRYFIIEVLPLSLRGQAAKPFPKRNGFCFLGGIVRAFVYIDGFNLYYRAVKGTKYKWLNLRKMCEMLVPEYKIGHIKYFTAPVSGKGDTDKPVRQQTYFRALRTIGCEIIPGKFLSHDVPMRLAHNKRKTVLVTKTEEKGSDVNLASHLLIDGFTKQYDAAIIVSNDSDLAMPIAYVRDSLGLETIVINPAPKSTSKALVKSASKVRQLRKGVLGACQFPNVVKHPKGTIRKPASW